MRVAEQGCDQRLHYHEGLRANRVGSTAETPCKTQSPVHDHCCDTFDVPDLLDVRFCLLAAQMQTFQSMGANADGVRHR